MKHKMTLDELLHLNLKAGTKVIGYLGTCEYKLILSCPIGSNQVGFGSYYLARAASHEPWSSQDSVSGPYHLSVWSRFSLDKGEKIGRFIP